MKGKLIHTCILGIGNPLRGDDGIGPFICGELEKRRLPCIDILSSYQLYIEMSEGLSDYDLIIIVDAHEGKEAVRMERLDSSLNAASPISHEIDARLFLQFMEKLYPAKREYWLLIVKGEDFSMGNKLSPGAHKRAGEAVDRLLHFLKEKGIILNP